MKPVVIDKIASVTGNCRLQREARLGSEFPCREGDVVAVRVLDELETVAPPPGRYGLTDGRDRFDVDTLAATDRSRYADVLATHHAGVEQMFHTSGIALLHLQTTDNVGEAIAAQLSAAPARRRRVA